MGISLSHHRYEEIKKIIVDLFIKYEVTCVPVERIYYYNGKHYVLTGIGTNGFIVTAYPIEYGC